MPKKKRKWKPQQNGPYEIVKAICPNPDCRRVIKTARLYRVKGKLKVRSSGMSKHLRSHQDCMNAFIGRYPHHYTKDNFAPLLHPAYKNVFLKDTSTPFTPEDFGLTNTTCTLSPSQPQGSSIHTTLNHQIMYDGNIPPISRKTIEIALGEDFDGFLFNNSDSDTSTASDNDDNSDTQVDESGNNELTQSPSANNDTSNPVNQDVRGGTRPSTVVPDPKTIPSLDPSL